MKSEMTGSYYVPRLRADHEPAFQCNPAAADRAHRGFCREAVAPAAALAVVGS